MTCMISTCPIIIHLLWTVDPWSAIIHLRSQSEGSFYTVCCVLLNSHTPSSCRRTIIGSAAIVT